MGSTSKIIGAIVIALGVGVGGYVIYSDDTDEAVDATAVAVSETGEATEEAPEETAAEETASAITEEAETSAPAEDAVEPAAEETEMAAVSTDTEDHPATMTEGNPTLVIEVGGTTTGTIEIELLADIAPGHVARVVELAQSGRYDNVVFHRVIEGFMAQTGDVEFGTRETTFPKRAGQGGSGMADLKAEFSDENYVVGTVGMARSNSPDSANSQFFIMFAPAPFLEGQYTVIGNVIAGQDVVNALKKGDASDNGSVQDPDYMAKVTVK